ASIINDGSAAPYRLVITSDDSGTANALTITNNLNQGAGQALTLSQTVAAADAALQINGVNITSSSNAVTGAIEGVTLNLRAASGTAVVSVGRDVEGILEKLRDFAAKYSEVAGYISSQFRYDPNKKDAGVLAGDFTLRDTQSRLSSTLSLNISSDNAALRLLSQIGFKLANDGTLSIDETALRSSLESDFRGTAHVILADAVNFAGETVSIGPRMYSQLKELTDSLDGSVFRARDNVQKDIDRLNKQIRDMEERLEIKRDLLIMQFGRADLALRQLSVLQNSLMGQINSLQLLNG
ncbi:MAG: flagellar filament capping protein FliD, partial [Acidobacteriota bacterium]